MAVSGSKKSEKSEETGQGRAVWEPREDSPLHNHSVCDAQGWKLFWLRFARWRIAQAVEFLLEQQPLCGDKFGWGSGSSWCWTGNTAVGYLLEPPDQNSRCGWTGGQWERKMTCRARRHPDSSLCLFAAAGSSSSQRCRRLNGEKLVINTAR